MISTICGIKNNVDLIEFEGWVIEMLGTHVWNGKMRPVETTLRRGQGRRIKENDGEGESS
jgi:hypothetical protein